MFSDILNTPLTLFIKNKNKKALPILLFIYELL